MGHYYWSGGFGPDTTYQNPNPTTGVQGDNQVVTQAQGFADRLIRVRYNAYAVVDVEPTSPNKPIIGWWANAEVYTGLWSDNGDGTVPAPNAGADFGPVPAWLTHEMLTPIATLQGTQFAFGYQIVFGLPGGVIDVEPQRGAPLGNNHPQIWASWNANSLVSFIPNSRAGGVDYGVAMHMMVRALWFQP
jgi:hypothetical protein